MPSIALREKNIMPSQGGKLWDSLFILVKDNDKDFIIDYINRLPCDFCIKDTHEKLNKLNLDFDNKSINETRRLLWTLRCNLIKKYNDTDEDFNNYLDYLRLI